MSGAQPTNVAKPPPEVVVATRNPHKLRELSQQLPDLALVPLPEEVELPPEGKESFAANALAKARAANRVTGMAAIADDSGIEAAALDWGPGVLSSRYAGEGASDEKNLAKLLGELEGASDRRVAYVCALAHVDRSGRELLVEGRCDGTLAERPSGRGGFGYDPAFVPADTPPDDQRTMAELSPEEKNAISHRGRAARVLAEQLRSETAADKAMGTAE